MAENEPKLGWIGIGRMGYPMVERLARAGFDLSIWNRTRSKAEPLAALGVTIVGGAADLAACDVLFTMVSTGKDLEQVYFGDGGVLDRTDGEVPGIFVDCSSIGVVSGPRPRFEVVKAYLEAIAGAGVSYVGDGELARTCKIAHNVFLGVVVQNLAEITIMAQKAGVPRHAFLDFMNNSVLGSVFTRYKTPALVNLDWSTTFTPPLLRKDMDLGLEAGRALDVAMPVTAAAREALQAHFGAATIRNDPEYLARDFSAVLETVALAAGIELEAENVPLSTGLEG